MSTRASFLTTFPSSPERWEWLPGREDIRESSLLVQSGQEAGVEELDTSAVSPWGTVARVGQGTQRPVSVT